MKNIKLRMKHCAMCGSICWVRDPVTPPEREEHNLDLRPLGIERGTLIYWTEGCGCCGYVNTDIQEENGVSKEYLQSEEFQTCCNAGLKTVLASRFYQYSLILEQIGDMKEGFKNLLYAAWSSDDLDDIEGARACRRKMIDMFEKLPEEYKSDYGYQLIIADVMRRAGEFQMAIEKYSSFDCGYALANKLMDFHIALCERKDDKPYSLKDIF